MLKKYDIVKQKKEDYRLSGLQESILRHVCTTKNSGYHSLCKATARKRTTIIQSLQPLRNRHYIDAYKEDPENSRSTLIFKPTDKGAYYAVAHLNIDIDEIVRSDLGDQEMESHYEFIRSIPNYAGRKEIFKQIALIAIKYNVFDKSGRLITTNRRELFNVGLKLGLYEAIKQRDYMPTYIFDEHSSKSLAKISTPEERKELKDYLANTRDNFDSTFKHLLKQFPD
jgi:hypothetical protein